MDKTQVNVRLPKELVDDIDEMVKEGRFPSKTDAFSEALRLLLRTMKGDELAKKIDRIREGTETFSSSAEAVVASHEEEDERLG